MVFGLRLAPSTPQPWRSGGLEDQTPGGLEGCPAVDGKAARAEGRVQAKVWRQLSLLSNQWEGGLQQLGGGLKVMSTVL